MMCFSKINRIVIMIVIPFTLYSFSSHYSSCPVSQCWESKEIKDEEDLNKMQSITLLVKPINQGFKSTSSANIKARYFSIYN